MNSLLPPEIIKNIPLLSEEICKQIPIEFAPLLITGYNVPVKYFEPQIVSEEKLDEFLEAYPEYISGQNGEMIQIIT